MKHLSRLLSLCALTTFSLAPALHAEDTGYRDYGNSGNSYGQSAPYGNPNDGNYGSPGYPQGYGSQPSGGGQQYGGGSTYYPPNQGSGSYGGYDNSQPGNSYNNSYNNNYGSQGGWQQQQQQPINRGYNDYPQQGYRPSMDGGGRYPSNQGYPPAVQRSYGNDGGGYPPGGGNAGNWRNEGGGYQGGGSSYNSQPYNSPGMGGSSYNSYGSQPYGGYNQSPPMPQSGSRYNPFESQSNIPPDSGFFGREPSRRPDERLTPPPTGGDRGSALPPPANPWTSKGDQGGIKPGVYPPVVENKDVTASSPPPLASPGQIIAPEAVVAPPAAPSGTTPQP
ncbi:MAG: hypothetical protein G8345_09265 [Magnetococcales bacterium]|nr:hypothetical protein [Magnetococcales bacterium]